MQIVYLDIVAYSQREPANQLAVVMAFQEITRRTLLTMNTDYETYLVQRDFDMLRDCILLPTGDGVAIGIPFVDLTDLALNLIKTILGKVEAHNRKSRGCEKLKSDKWCNCHNGFYLRCGIGEGRVLLFRDLTGRFNVAGTPINLAARVMNLGGPNQIFFTEGAYREYVDFEPEEETNFHAYHDVTIKHGLSINVYQYCSSGVAGLNTDRHEESRSSPSYDVSPATPQSDAGSPAALQAGMITVNQPSHIFQLLNRLRTIPKGNYIMGEGGKKILEVNITRPFRIDPYLVTQQFFEEVMGSGHKNHFSGDNLPVDRVTWIQAVEFCNRLSEQAKLDPVYRIDRESVHADLANNGFRLPSEAEWEYACRAGGSHQPPVPLERHAWFNRNSRRISHPIGGLTPNNFGLYDMLGNLWEWCHDWYGADFPQGSTDDYVGANGPEVVERVLRGGSWLDIAPVITPTYRKRAVPTSSHKTYGFRIVSTAS